MVIFLVIATVRYDILFDRMIPHALYVDSQPLISVTFDVFINADMIIIMNNDNLMDLLMNYST